MFEYALFLNCVLVDEELLQIESCCPQNLCQSRDLSGHCRQKQVERGNKGGTITTHDECPYGGGGDTRAGGS